MKKITKTLSKTLTLNYFELSHQPYNKNQWSLFESWSTEKDERITSRVEFKTLEKAKDYIHKEIGVEL